ncbi:MAG: prolipoprotein diacylglyceryl transferase [Cyanobacteria bacterium SW_4_48_29]|jgi:phosphatidylglycerol:prolipoprotein diacylglycerol transferase|nr:MAG: prolipoprotein diacylglyceryl transferase [Cyanobacteria bacterium QH_2_48_84]PSO67987.1 MAG: prolipoprotein diacylglyceryl transferase [Cyanobacteria bacterium QH_7_48_89]PSP08574.1 MAG: prolipoprotein diacylglyceryl transferase [Cyanobacteria bacterium SW_10_48_33]PSP14867.1 MAG: prolipoprotein diacylglyceryl transferase [Cyanobacteria bacterium SW_5_48_44]PSP21585.1 MAG: prolipoprotein diacylglyceryl transferase [Cyanobacteria bacterium SW_8_48_13]PSP27831.1 MAG: prolipoprotein diac
MLSLAFQFQSPGPILFEIGPVAIRWYGFLIASAVLIGTFLSQYLATRRKINPELLGDLSIWLVIAAIPGARIYYVLFQWQEYAQNPAEILAIWRGGIAIHGAIFGAVIAGTIFARIKQVSVWQLADLVAPSLILGQAIGRWGNFFNSEAFGTPTDLPWKLYIPPEQRPPQYLNYEYFHPTFLYESLWNWMVLGLLLFLFFWGLRHRERLKVGTIALVYLIAYSCGRIWIEGLRTDSLMLGSLQIAQVISLVLIALGVAGLVWLYGFKRPLPDVISPKTKRQNKRNS